ncbi:MAG: penicillin acylase family protein [Proteobacteria bacterium]|nr:penicillin acylase family protein [Pseudomonadota bacterium]
MSKALRWTLRIIGSILCLLIIGLVGGYLFLRSGLPQIDGEITLKGVSAAVSITRDERGVPTISAQSSDDAYFALGFVHAQDRLFQMDAMRRLGAGRLSEILGDTALETDRLMRTLGLYASAEDQVNAASPALKAALTAYAAGVNAFIANHSGAWPPEFYLLNYRPEAWQPADSLVWGRLMALDLSNNWQAEASNRSMKRGVPAYLYDLLVTAPSPRAASNDGGNLPLLRQPLSEASNSWVVGPQQSASGKPLIANDPHLGLALPSTWYLARIETPEMTWTGATAPGMPFIIIGTNQLVAWTFTTTHGDTQDLFEEKLVAGRANQYETPDGPQPFVTHQEKIRVKGADDTEITIRSTRHGPVVSDLGGDPGTPDTVLALSWTALLPDDRTPEAILAINKARDAAALEVALIDFHAPEQNVVYADAEGITGFIAAGRVPQRRTIFEGSRLPAPGWSGAYDWIGTLPMSSLPQLRGDSIDFLVTANNDIRPLGYRPFITADWPDDARARRIRELLRAGALHTLDRLKSIQLDSHSAPLLAFVRHWQSEAAKADPDLAANLIDWDGSMDRNAAAPLIATIWVDRVAKRLLADEMRGHFSDWWFWQIDRLELLLADGRACDDVESPAKDSCADILAAAFADTRRDLTAAYGSDPTHWHWGDSHRAPFNHPVYSHIPLLKDWLSADLATDGDFFSVNRGTTLPPRNGVALPHIHGPSLRFLMDFADPDGALFVLAGGQSGNPLSPHFTDGLADWRDGSYRLLKEGGSNQLVLEPVSTP